MAINNYVMFIIIMFAFFIMKALDKWILIFPGEMIN